MLVARRCGCYAIRSLHSTVSGSRTLTQRMDRVQKQSLDAILLPHLPSSPRSITSRAHDQSGLWPSTFTSTSLSASSHRSVPALPSSPANEQRRHFFSAYRKLKQDYTDFQRDWKLYRLIQKILNWKTTLALKVFRLVRPKVELTPQKKKRRRVLKLILFLLVGGSVYILFVGLDDERESILHLVDMFRYWSQGMWEQLTEAEEDASVSEDEDDLPALISFAAELKGCESLTPAASSLFQPLSTSEIDFLREFIPDDLSTFLSRRDTFFLHESLSAGPLPGLVFYVLITQQLDRAVKLLLIQARKQERAGCHTNAQRLRDRARITMFESFSLCRTALAELAKDTPTTPSTHLMRAGRVYPLLAQARAKAMVGEEKAAEEYMTRAHTILSSPLSEQEANRRDLRRKITMRKEDGPVYDELVLTDRYAKAELERLRGELCESRKDWIGARQAYTASFSQLRPSLLEAIVPETLLLRLLKRATYAALQAKDVQSATAAVKAGEQLVAERYATVDANHAVQLKEFKSASPARPASESADLQAKQNERRRQEEQALAPIEEQTEKMRRAINKMQSGKK